MDKCYFRVERDGIFVKCNALRVGHCPNGCTFRKTETEFVAGVERAEKRLRDLGLVVVDDIKPNVGHIMTVKKWGE